MSAFTDIIKEQKWDLALIIVGIAGLALSFISETFEAAVWIPVLVCGTPIIFGAIMGMVEEFDITADVLVSIAIVASYLIGQPEAAAEIAIIMQIGSFLEEAIAGCGMFGITNISKFFL